MKREGLYIGTAGNPVISSETIALSILERLVLDSKPSHFTFSIREKVAFGLDEGQPGNQGIWLTDWPGDAQHIDPAVGESSFGRECGVSWLLS